MRRSAFPFLQSRCGCAQMCRMPSASSAGLTLSAWCQSLCPSAPLRPRPRTRGTGRPPLLRSLSPARPSRQAAPLRKPGPWHRRCTNAEVPSLPLAKACGDLSGCDGRCPEDGHFQSGGGAKSREWASGQALDAPHWRRIQPPSNPSGPTRPHHYKTAFVEPKTVLFASRAACVHSTATGMASLILPY